MDRLHTDVTYKQDDFIAVLAARGNWLHLPTNAAWSQAVTGSGGSTLIPAYVEVYTGTTPASTASRRCTISGFLIGSSGFTFPFDKKFRCIFNYERLISDADVIARVQFKQATTIGALDAKGLGIRVDNLALVGESYGTELGEVSLGNLTISEVAQIAITLDPDIPKITWELNGAVVGEQTTAAKIPTGTLSICYMITSIERAGAGIGDCRTKLFHPMLWGEM